MPFSATINLGTVGVAITSVKLYGCTGNNGTDCTGCTVLTGYENVSVSTFPLLVSGIPNGVRYIQAEALGACSADAVKQCITISGIPGPTATPAPTATLNGSTPGPTATQTPTPTPTPSQSAGPCGAPTISNVTRSGLNDIVKFLYDLEDGVELSHKELQLTYYNKDCRFVPHTDGPQTGILCSMILYLNENYNRDNGGLLVFNDELITPELGICAIMDLTKHDIKHGVTKVVDGPGRFAILSFPKNKNNNLI